MFAVYGTKVTIELDSLIKSSLAIETICIELVASLPAGILQHIIQHLYLAPEVVVGGWFLKLVSGLSLVYWM